MPASKISINNPFGAILAGGRSRRMSGANKALQNLAGRPLLSHVISRMQSQCCSLCLSVELADACWEPFGLAQLADTKPGSNGPLGGLLAALEFSSSQAEWLMLAPCDAPFLPMNLAERLAGAAAAENTPAALVGYKGQWQPTFSLWHVELLAKLRSAVTEKNQKGLKEFLFSIPHALVPWEEREVSPFFNINTPEDLSAADKVLEQGLPN